MRAVLDTNCVISGLFWGGPGRTLLDLSKARRIAAFTTLPLLAELAAVLARPKFAARLKAAHVDPDSLVLGYAALAQIIHRPPPIPPVCRDPSDDEVLACALAAHADLIVSGDKDLLVLKRYCQIEIASPSAAVAITLSSTKP